MQPPLRKGRYRSLPVRQGGLSRCCLGRVRRRSRRPSPASRAGAGSSRAATLPHFSRQYRDYSFRTRRAEEKTLDLAGGGFGQLGDEAEFVRAFEADEAGGPPAVYLAVAPASGARVSGRANDK